MGTYYSNTFRSFGTATTTEIRNYLTDVKAGMTSSGWAVASDTGQVDEATATNPGTAATVIGYHMFYLNDSQHSTYPIYLKRVYSTSTSASNRLKSTVQLGISTDGAGNFTNGTLGTVRNLYLGGTGNSPAAGAYPFLGSYGDGYATICESIGAWTTSSFTTPVLSVAREFDQTTGLPATNGNFTMLSVESTASNAPAGIYTVGYNRQYMAEYSLGFTSSSALNCFVPMSTAIPGSSVELFTHMYRTREPVVNPALMSYQTTDIAADSIITADALGVTRTYRATVVKYPTTASVTAYSLAVLWE